MNLQAEYIDLTRQAPFALGALEIRPATREVVAGNQREVLEPRVMQVLVALARQTGEVVSRDELIAQCWAGRVVGDDAINRCIGRIRRLAGSYGGFALETIMHVGYRLTVEPKSPATTPPPASEPGPAWFAALKIRRSFVGYAIGCAILALLLALAIVGSFGHREGDREGADRAPPSVRRVIAVLPFTPLSPDPAAQLFGDQVAATVAETLSKIGQPVVPTVDSFQYRGGAKARAARELHAMYVIDGEVIREGGKIRVTVRLNDTVHGMTIFVSAVDAPAERADALPERVATHIASLSWGTDITRWDEESIQAMLRAFDQQKRGDLFAAYETARAAAMAEPGNAAVQRVYASDTINLVYASLAARKVSLIEEARQAARRALQLDPSSGEAYANFASSTPHFLWAERESWLRKSLSITPDSVAVQEYLTWLLDDVGRFRDAEPAIRSAHERFPYHVVSYQRRIEQLLGAGEAAAALQVLPHARRLWPDETVFLDLGFEAAVLQGSPGNAAAFLNDPDVVRQLAPARAALWKAIARALQDRRPGDIAAVSHGCADPGQDWSACMIALSQLGKRDDAFRIAAAAYPDQRAPSPEALMQKWLANPELPSTRYLFLPAAAPMRADPRFREVVERVGLLQYWQAVHHAPDFCAAGPVPVCRLIR